MSPSSARPWGELQDEAVCVGWLFLFLPSITRSALSVTWPSFPDAISSRRRPDRGMQASGNMGSPIDSVVTHHRQGGLLARPSHPGLGCRCEDLCMLLRMHRKMLLTAASNAASACPPSYFLHSWCRAVPARSQSRLDTVLSKDLLAGLPGKCAFRRLTRCSIPSRAAASVDHDATVSLTTSESSALRTVYIESWRRVRGTL